MISAKYTFNKYSETFILQIRINNSLGGELSINLLGMNKDSLMKFSSVPVITQIVIPKKLLTKSSVKIRNIEYLIIPNNHSEFSKPYGFKQEMRSSKINIKSTDKESSKQFKGVKNV